MKRCTLGLFAALAVLAPDPSGAATRTVCTCYFTSDCPEGFQCGMYADGWPDEDDLTCWRTEPKGGAWNGACDEFVPGFEIGGLCDGKCFREPIIIIDPELLDIVRFLVRTWGAAMTTAAINGGGPVDPQLAQAARAAPVDDRLNEFIARQVLSFMLMCRGDDFIAHPEGPHLAEDHVVTDLRGDACRVRSGELCIRAILAGLDEGAHAIDPIVEEIGEACPQGLPFGRTGLDREPMDAVKVRLRTFVESLTGPLDDDQCPDDPDKLEPGVCGCGVPDLDQDHDGTADCVDNCAAHPNPDQADADQDGHGDACDPCPLDPADDADHDDVCGDVDVCPGTHIPESVPHTGFLLPGRWALVDADPVFDTTILFRRHPRAFTLADTAGCSCEQIIAAADLGHFHRWFGCSTRALSAWHRIHAP